MEGYRIEWAQFGHFDSFDVIRSYTSLENVTDHDLPMPIATNIKTMYFIDTTMIVGVEIFYRIRCWRGSESVVSDQVKIKDIYYSKVELLLLANAASYPSTAIVDKSKYARSVTRNGVSIVNSITTIDGGAFDFTNTSGVRYLQASISALNTSDFTIEFFCRMNSYTSVYQRVLVLDTQEVVSSAALQLQVADNGTFRWYINNGTIRQVAISLQPVARNTLQHHCLIRKNGVFYYFIDGVLQSAYDQYTTYQITKTNFRLGGYISNMTGYISSLRATKASRYNTDGFTPPSEMFSNY